MHERTFTLLKNSATLSNQCNTRIKHEHERAKRQVVPTNQLCWKWKKKNPQHSQKQHNTITFNYYILPPVFKLLKVQKKRNKDNLQGLKQKKKLQRRKAKKKDKLEGLNIFINL